MAKEGSCVRAEVEESFWEEGMQAEEVELARWSIKGASFPPSMGRDPLGWQADRR